MSSGLYDNIAAAFVRGTLPEATSLDDPSAIALGRSRGLKLHRFKRSSALPRVKRVLGSLAGLAPESLLDVGSGRGAFLWPLADSFHALPIFSVDVLQHRAAVVAAVSRGGLRNLNSLVASGNELPLRDDACDVVTVLEVLEHQLDPTAMAAEALRVASRAVVVSVPSKEDNNPEHVQLFTGESLSELLVACGARRVNIDFVPNHIVAVALR